MDTGKKKILLAEDNAINQKVAMLMLKKYDQSIDIADNGQIAVEKFMKEEYDLVLMDLHMPELDGFEATMKIREIEMKENRSKKVKIYAMTASSINDESARCYAVGMDGYISKPFRVEEVIKVLS
ncbi:MAG: response regulator [Lentimicrobiaceae bacterium]|nr:response regulator [Lentimicrobiaceae bacterium]MCB9024031.1 response regulator [Lentimicrobiaceae bacterium]MCO5265790.1 response regulator [Lentimicrobium sp.]